MQGLRRAFKTDTNAVSEVVGHIMVFGIMSLVMIASLYAFVGAKDATTAEVAEVQAQSAAQRIANGLIESALFAEKSETTALFAEIQIDLDEDFEGVNYVIDLDTDKVVITLQTEAQVDVALLSAGVTGQVIICDQVTPLPGGPVAIKINSYDPGDATTAPPDCPNLGTSAVRAIYLEVYDGN